MPISFSNRSQGMIRDSLRYLDPVWIPDAKLGQGCIIGLVGGIMAAKNASFEETVAALAKEASRMRDFEPSTRRLPEAWVDEFMRHEDMFGF